MLTTEPRSETAQPTGSTALIAEIAALRAALDRAMRRACERDEGHTHSEDCGTCADVRALSQAIGRFEAQEGAPMSFLRRAAPLTEAGLRALAVDMGLGHVLAEPPSLAPGPVTMTSQPTAAERAELYEQTLETIVMMLTADSYQDSVRAYNRPGSRVSVGAGAALAAVMRAVNYINVGMKAAPKMPGTVSEAAEAAYWEFDARRKGINAWKGIPQAERDAFKQLYAAAILGARQPGPTPSQPDVVAQDVAQEAKAEGPA